MMMSGNKFSIILKKFIKPIKNIQFEQIKIKSQTHSIKSVPKFDIILAKNKATANFNDFQNIKTKKHKQII